MTYADLLATWAEVRASSDRSFPRGHRSGPTPRLDDLPPPPADRSGWPWTEGCKPLPPVTPDGAPWPHIAIVTPNYNYARFLEETIRSVLLQGYPNLSYAVVDDGSRDESMAIVARYAPWLAYHVTRANRGQSASINQGFRALAPYRPGDVLGWLNSDDLFHPGALARIGARMARRRRTVLLGTASIPAGADQPVDRIDARAPSWPAMAYDGRTVPQPATLWTADLWQLAGPLDPTLRFSMDYDLWLRMMPLADIVRDDGAPLAVERPHENQVFRQAQRRGVAQPFKREKAYAAVRAARRRGEPLPLWFLRSYGRRLRVALRRRRPGLALYSQWHRLTLRAALATDGRA